MKKLNHIQKLETKGGSFYAIALGIGILVSTVSTLVCNAISASKSGLSANDSFSSLRRTTMMRLSPVPSRSSVMVL